MIDYPEGLPYPLRENYGLEPVSPMTRSKLGNGRSEARRKFKNTPVLVNVIWELDAGQAQLFEAFFEYSLVSGVKKFECPLLTPLGLEKYTAEFDDIYKGGYLTKLKHWRYTAQLWLLKRPLIAKDWLDYGPEFVLYSDIFDRAINQDWPKLIE